MFFLSSEEEDRRCFYDKVSMVRKNNRSQVWSSALEGCLGSAHLHPVLAHGLTEFTTSCICLKLYLQIHVKFISKSKGFVSVLLRKSF